MRYVTYNAGIDSNDITFGSAGETGQTASSRPKAVSTASGHHEAVANASIKPTRDVTRASDAMADLHLSGSDLRMFPGILTRDHQSVNFRTLAQAGEWPVDSNEVPGAEDDV